MADDEQLVRLAEQFQAQLAAATLTDLRQVLAGSRPCPDGAVVESTTVGKRGSSALEVIITAENADKVWLTVFPTQVTVNQVQRGTTTQSWTILSTPDDKQQFKAEVKAFAEEHPEIAPLLRDSTCPSGERIEFQSRSQPEGRAR